MICEWPLIYQNCDGGEPGEPCGDLADVDEEMRTAIEQMAIEMLAEATNGMFGLCEVEVRPCRQGCQGNAQWASTFWGRGPRFDPGFPRLGGGMGGGAFYPVLVSGQWFNMTCGCLGACACSPSGPTVLTLPGPVDSITEVTIDGITLDPGAYRVDRKRWLVRTDGETWPGCQDMNAAPDAIGSFVVRYMKGIPVPSGGQIAAGLLAQQIAMMLCGNDECALPDNWTTITRQGLTISEQNPETPWEQTGIWLIDNWVSRVTTPRSFASVRSVDVPVER